jgi:hypothetical protein
MIPNKLLVALVASAFSFGSVGAMADDKTPAQRVDPAKLKAEKDAAKAAAAKMTPEDDSPLWRTGDFYPKKGWADAKARKEAAAKERVAKRQAEIDAKRKAGAANKPTNEQRQKDLTEQSRKGSGQ